MKSSFDSDETDQEESPNAIHNRKKYLFSSRANCLAEFLFEKYGEEYVIGHEILKLPKTKKEKINYSNRIKYGDKYYVYRWDSNKSGKEERVFLKKGFTSNQNGFDKLNECLAMKISEDNSIAHNKDTRPSKKFYKLFKSLNPKQLFSKKCSNEVNLFKKFYKLYKSFNPKQLYFKYIPIFEEGFYYHPKETEDNEDKDNKKEEAEDNEIKDNKAKEICVICLDELKIKNFVYSCLTCKRIYHDNCFAPWLNVNSTCPNCRGKIKLTPKLTHDHPTNVNSFNKIWPKGGSKKKT
uniref:RING-type domain-containing protein n=1 Tax=Meloidogyne enterolobii TaxID=390850 RepID=A0A6V7XGP0_MELEN|nr:unnamed protein product [Meloidogyne enterolobii]